MPAAFHVGPEADVAAPRTTRRVDRAAHVLQPRDWIALTLTGELATDGTHAAATLVIRPARPGVGSGPRGLAGRPARVVPAGAPIRRGRGAGPARIARRTGLKPGTPVVIGGADSQACALGAGVVGPGPVSEMAGSSTCLNAVVPIACSVLEVTHYPHVVGGVLTTETGLNTTGAASPGSPTWPTGTCGPRRRRRLRPARRSRRGVAGGRRRFSSCPASATASGRPDLRGRPRRAVAAPRPGRASPGPCSRAWPSRSRDQLDLLRQGGIASRRSCGSPAATRASTTSEPDQGRRHSALPVRTVPGDAAVTGVAMLAGLGAGFYATWPTPRAVRRPGPGDRARPGDGAYDDAFERPRSRRPRWCGRHRRRRLMQLRLGINTCFAVKRWPRPEDWAPIVSRGSGWGSSSTRSTSSTSPPTTPAGSARRPPATPRRPTASR